ncbi:hypothetical protein IFM89_000252 [Coptis chinensis]|uniref:Uncharacterized protein n=1 Tax=Coptis chinensis TaxID=261450 RepID=A0A835IHZ1_9MAGN|nr:hypothetical protein IFM89_000252 [Coptis chinensis]
MVPNVFQLSLAFAFYHSLCAFPLTENSMAIIDALKDKNDYHVFSALPEKCPSATMEEAVLEIFNYMTDPANFGAITIEGYDRDIGGSRMYLFHIPFYIGQYKITETIDFLREEAADISDSGSEQTVHKKIIRNSVEAITPDMLMECLLYCALLDGKSILNVLLEHNLVETLAHPGDPKKYSEALPRITLELPPNMVKYNSFWPIVTSHNDGKSLRGLASSAQHTKMKNHQKFQLVFFSLLQTAQDFVLNLFIDDPPSFQDFSENFFENMQKLRVLNLKNAWISSLPSSLALLCNSLKVLNFQGCKRLESLSVPLLQILRNLRSLEIERGKRFSRNISGDQEIVRFQSQKHGRSKRVLDREVPRDGGECSREEHMNLEYCPRLNTCPALNKITVKGCPRFAKLPLHHGLGYHCSRTSSSLNPVQVVK